MFCPKCATQSVEGASYCRNCGANLRLVPQALDGQLMPVNQEDDPYFGRRAPSTARAVRRLSMGVVLSVIIALTFSAASSGHVIWIAPGKTYWWVWLLLPAMLMFGRGFAELMRVNARKNLRPQKEQPMVKAVRSPDLPAPKTGELMSAVPSVTEGTTRHLETDARTRQL